MRAPASRSRRPQTLTTAPALALVLILLLAACGGGDAGTATSDAPDADKDDSGGIQLDDDEPTPESLTGPDSPGGTELDSAALEREITTGILDQTGFDVSVTCPVDIVAVAGDTFDCVFATDSGERGNVNVEATDDEGNVSWTTESEGLAINASSQSVFELGVGDCLNNETVGEVTDVDIVDCSAPHDQEVYALFDMEGEPGAPYPGQEATSAAAARCRSEFFEPYVGLPAIESRLSSTSLNPTSGSWDQGDREIVCLLVSPDEGEKLTGTFRSSGEESQYTIFGLDVGECLNTVEDAPLDPVILPCAEAHDYEVYAVFDIAGDPSSAFDQAVVDASTARCTEEFFEPYVGTAYASSAIFSTQFSPNEATWDQGDREVVCLLVGEDGAQLTGSQQGTGN